MSSLRYILPGLLPLVLGACMNAGPADANPSVNASPIGTDLGSSAQHMADRPALATDPNPVGAGHEMRGTARSGEMVMAHAGHTRTQASGTVNSVNQAGHTINVSHGPIQALGWPPMTMDFPVAPSVDLRSVKPGEKVNFTLEKGSDGMPVIKSVTPTTGGK